jgi:hypothetical protein
VPAATMALAFARPSPCMSQGARQGVDVLDPEPTPRAHEHGSEEALLDEALHRSAGAVHICRSALYVEKGAPHRCVCWDVLSHPVIEPQIVTPVWFPTEVRNALDVCFRGRLLDRPDPFPSMFERVHPLIAPLKRPDDGELGKAEETLEAFVHDFLLVRVGERLGNRDRR